MKKNLKKMVKKVAEIACIVGLTLTVNGMIDNAKDTQVQPVVNIQEVSKQLIPEEKSQPLSTVASKENWLNEENEENKDLIENVTIEDGNKTIEISKKVYDETEQGKNSDLGDEDMDGTKDYLDTITVNDTVNNIDDSDITDIEDVEVVTDKEDIKYTQEDYDKYLEYKQGLIDEHGEEIYNLMNQEAGIENEEESFYHFMEYGI